MSYLVNDWADIGIASEGLKFFYQRWGELLGTLSPVSHQAPIAGAPQILREILEADGTYKRTGHGEGALQALKEEAFGKQVNPYGRVEGTVNQDHVAVALLEENVGPLSPQRGFFATGTPPAAVDAAREDTLSRLRSRILNERYLPVLVEKLKAALRLGDEGHLGADAYREIDSLATAFVSELLSMGFADSFLRVHQSILAKIEQPEEERVDRFMARLSRAPIAVDVVLMVQASPDYWGSWPDGTFDAYLRARDVPCLPDNWGGPHLALLREGMSSEADNLRYVHLSLESKDHHAATREAYHLFHRTADLVTVEFPRVKANVVRAATVRSGEHWTRVNVVDASQMQIEPIPAVQTSKALEEDLSGFAARFTQRVGQGMPRRQVEGALRYYRISLEESWLESGLTNLWTSLETLAPQDPRRIIDRVAGAVAPLMGSFKAKTMAEVLIGYLLQYGITEKDFYEETLGGARGEDGLMSPHLITRLLADRAIATNLASKVQDSPLLVFRIMSFSDDVQTGSGLAKVIYRTTRKVEWQVRRLYRMRNDIVHGAASPENLQRLTQHLQLYAIRLILAVSNLLEKENGIDTVDDAISIIDTCYHNWIDDLRGMGSNGSVYGSNNIKDLSPEEVFKIISPPFGLHL